MTQKSVVQIVIWTMNGLFVALLLAHYKGALTIGDGQPHLVWAMVFACILFSAWHGGWGRGLLRYLAWVGSYAVQKQVTDLERTVVFWMTVMVCPIAIAACADGYSILVIGLFAGFFLGIFIFFFPPRWLQKRAPNFFPD